MTETIDSANAAASTLFLGQNGEFWDFWLIISLVAVALAAIAAGVTTTGSIVSHKREAVASEEALERYKLGTSKEISESNARTSEAQLELQRLKSWRMVDGAKFKAALADIAPPKNIEILYVPECSDCFMLASTAAAILNDMKWSLTLDELKKQSNPSQEWMKGVPATLQYHANPTGISIVTKVFSEPTENVAVGALLRAFGVTMAGGMMLAQDEAVPDDIIRIVIAPKI
jgi:hypothetical protein